MFGDVGMWRLQHSPVSDSGGSSEDQNAYRNVDSEGQAHDSWELDQRPFRLPAGHERGYILSMP
jgi:hypothetical protein